MAAVYDVSGLVWFAGDDEPADSDTICVIAESGALAAAAAVADMLGRDWLRYDKDGNELPGKHRAVRADVESIERLRTIDINALD